MEELARTCKNSQATLIMSKAINRIHLNELMHELVKTCKNFQVAPKRSKTKAKRNEHDTKARIKSK
jgi:hypothetical protein